MRMKKSFNFKPTLSIRRLKDNPDVDKSLSVPLLIWSSLGDTLLERGRVRWVSLLFLGPTNLIRFRDLTSWLGKRQLSPSRFFPLLVADRWSRYVCVLVWFRLGVLVFILISVLWGISDRLLAIVFGHIHDGIMLGLGEGDALCFRIISSFLFVGWKNSSSCICCCVREISSPISDTEREGSGLYSRPHNLCIVRN